MDRLKFKHISYLILAMKAVLIVLLVLQFIRSDESATLVIDREFLFYCLAGFVAQLIDGTLGMAYGVSCTTLLLSFGIPPALASASVHTAEVFTTGVSGLSHLYLKNVDKHLFIRLAIPGIIGAVIGAFLLSDILDGNQVKPFIAAYLLILGIVIIIKGIKNPLFKDEIKNLAPLGFFGGLLDAIGGGGWGPIVTSNVIRQGKTPKLTIGTVNTAEFFIAFFCTGTFLILLGLEGWKMILGLIIGGVPAAPIGAILVKFVRPRILLFLVGAGVIISSGYIVYLAWFK